MISCLYCTAICGQASLDNICSDFIMTSHPEARERMLSVVGEANIFKIIPKELKMSTENPKVTLIKELVANKDAQGVENLRPSGKDAIAISYLIIAASNLVGDSKVVGARMATEQKQGKARRDVLVDILLELAKAGDAPKEEEEVPFTPDPAPVVEEEKPKKKVTRRRKKPAPKPEPETPALPVSSDATELIIKVGDMVETIHKGLSESLPSAQSGIDALMANGANLYQFAQKFDKGQVHCISRVNKLEEKLDKFKDAFSGFEQALLIAGVISEAPFTEATSDWD